MKKTPPGWPRISSALYYDDPAKAIDWLCNAFGFTVRIKVEGENGTIEHCELDFGDDGLIMVGGTHRDQWRRSPKAISGGNTQSVMIYVDDAAAHCERARAAGARIAVEPMVADYGPDHWSDKSYEAIDVEGHHWWICERLRDPPAPR